MWMRLLELSELPWVQALLALPDLHQKAKAEVPSSIALTSRAIVPQFTSVAINDGMGVVATDLDARDLTPERIVEFFRRVNANSARHVLDANRYSLSSEDLEAAALEGAPVGIRRYGLDPATAAGMEGDGRIRIDGGAARWSEAVPLLLRKTRIGRSEMGLNFGGNHFLEMQAVDEIVDADRAREWGLERGQVLLMYHLGPGPFGGTLLHHFTRRVSLKGPRVPFMFLSKLLFHFGLGGTTESAWRKWNLHFRRQGWSVYPPDSEEGRMLRDAIAMATNFGYVYRLATIAAIRDALQETFSGRVGARLVCDISHNSIGEEPWGDGTAWVARHNACRLNPRRPTIVSGMFDVPSYLGVGASSPPEGLHSYDHGAGTIIDRWRAEGRLDARPGKTIRLRMTRGRDARLVSRTDVPLRTAAPVEHLMRCLERHGVLRSVARLRPIGTLKN
jgi:tRNA-splicing ligase RtcB